MSVSWKDIASVVGKNAPMLGTLFGGPGAAALGTLVASVFGSEATPDAIHASIAADPQAALKLAQFESDNKVKLQAMMFAHADNQIAADTQATLAVNATMQAEAGADHWPTYSWRPFIGFCVGVNTLAASLLVLVVFVPVMFGVKEAANAMSQLPLVLGALAAISGTVMPILGIASWFRGKAQADPGIPTDPRG